jgi:hypothetical protein
MRKPGIAHRREIGLRDRRALAGEQRARDRPLRPGDRHRDAREHRLAQGREASREPTFCAMRDHLDRPERRAGGAEA